MKASLICFKLHVLNRTQSRRRRASGTLRGPRSGLRRIPARFRRPDPARPPKNAANRERGGRPHSQPNPRSRARKASTKRAGAPCRPGAPSPRSRQGPGCGCCCRRASSAHQQGPDQHPARVPTSSVSAACLCTCAKIRAGAEASAGKAPSGRGAGPGPRPAGTLILVRRGPGSGRAPRPEGYFSNPALMDD